MNTNRVIVRSAFDLVNSYSTRQLNFMYNQMFWSSGSNDDYIDLNDDDTVGLHRRRDAIIRVLILADDLGGQR